jgi:membrane-bound ClpP family serine protease
MILMPILMLAPIAGVVLFSYLPLGTALPLYIPILIVGIFYNIVMFWAMRAKSKTGPEAMVGENALVIKDIDPEGKVKIRGELWRAIAQDSKITAGKEVKILKVRGMVLIVKDTDDDGKAAVRAPA